MAEYSASAQTINPGEAVVFNTVDPCNRGLVRHRDNTGSFLLSGWLPNFMNGCRCTKRSAQYRLDFGANIAVPTGGTAGEISVAFMVDGATVPYSTMKVTPAAAEEYFNVSRAMEVPIWRGCCETVTVINTSDQPILLDNGTLTISRSDLQVTY